MQFSGKVLRNRQVILDEVAGEYQLDPSGRMPSWSGSFTPLNDQCPMFGALELLLDDGRKGAILVRQLDLGAPGQKRITAHFEGTEPLE
jgi:hypothetical protein